MRAIGKVRLVAQHPIALPYMSYEEIINALNTLTPAETDALSAKINHLNEQRQRSFPQINESIEITAFAPGRSSIVIDGVDYSSSIMEYHITSTGIAIDWTRFAENDDVAIDGKFMLDPDRDRQRYFRVHYPVRFNFKGSTTQVYSLNADVDITLKSDSKTARKIEGSFNWEGEDIDI